jgi:hypothetical protein
MTASEVKLEMGDENEVSGVLCEVGYECCVCLLLRCNQLQS